jgi:hypothetical protein
VLKNGASGRDPALCGFCKCSHMHQYAALSKTPHALADGLMLVFEHPVKWHFNNVIKKGRLPKRQTALDFSAGSQIRPRPSIFCRP